MLLLLLQLLAHPRVRCTAWLLHTVRRCEVYGRRLVCLFAGVPFNQNRVLLYSLLFVYIHIFTYIRTCVRQQTLYSLWCISASVRSFRQLIAANRLRGISLHFTKLDALLSPALLFCALRLVIWRLFHGLCSKGSCSLYRLL